MLLQGELAECSLFIGPIVLRWARSGARQPAHLVDQVGKPNLCKNIIRAVTSDAKTPAIDEAPLTDQVG